MRSIRGPFLLTALQFLVAGAIVVGAGMVLDPDATGARVATVLAVVLGVMVVTHLYRRSRDDTWPALQRGESVDQAIGIEDEPERPRIPDEWDLIDDRSLRSDDDGNDADSGRPDRSPGETDGASDGQR